MVVEESLAVAATVVLVALTEADCEAVVNVADAGAEAFCAPRVSLFDPLPSGTLSRKSGSLNVDDPSPEPKAVPIIANRAANVLQLIAVPSHSR